MSTIDNIKNICSSNTVSYLEKYAYDKFNSKENIIILKAVTDILYFDKSYMKLSSSDIVNLYYLILELRDSDPVMFKGVTLIDAPGENKYNPDEPVTPGTPSAYDLIYSFIYS